MAGDGLLGPLPQLVVAVALDRGGHAGSAASPRPSRTERKSDAAATPGPQVDRPQLGPTGEVGEVGRGTDPLDALLGQRLGDLDLTVLDLGVRYCSTSLSVPVPDPTCRSSNQLPTMTIGEISVISRNWGDSADGEHHDARRRGARWPR